MAALLRITNTGSTVPVVIGDSTVPGHAGWIELESVQFGPTASMGIGGGGSTIPAATASMTEIHVSKRQDKSSPELFMMCATGKAGFDGQIDLLGDDSKDGLPYISYLLTDVLIASVHLGGRADGHETPGESLEIVTRKTETKHKGVRKA